ncbi:hypothetical protein Btru_075535 [Bulinus truncatus]|nr:hypothetical protein Btru_075535 [Bulinus truncatus]
MLYLPLLVILLLGGSAVQMTSADCNTMCPLEYDPVCASNGRTYPNICEMDSDSCVNNLGLTVASYGECP